MSWPKAMTRGTVPHRFLLIELKLADSELWFKLDRRPESKVSLVRGFGRTSAKDEVWCYRSQPLARKCADTPFVRASSLNITEKSCSRKATTERMNIS